MGDQYWERIERMIGLYVTEPGVQGYWSFFREWSTDDLIEYLDSRFAAAAPARKESQRRWRWRNSGGA